MTILTLCWEFFKTGLFAVGGGLATVPFLTQMARNHPDWFTMARLGDMIAVSESTPGPIGVNMATYAGFTVAGVPGAILATLSLVLPSWIIILIISRVLQRFRTNRLVDSAFSGLRPAVAGLIGAAGFSVLQMAVVRGQWGDGLLQFLDWRCAAIFAAVLAVTLWKKKIHPLVFVAAAAVLGILLGL